MKTKAENNNLYTTETISKYGPQINGCMCVRCVWLGHYTLTFLQNWLKGFILYNFTKMI